MEKQNFYTDTISKLVAYQQKGNALVYGNESSDALFAIAVELNHMSQSDLKELYSKIGNALSSQSNLNTIKALTWLQVSVNSRINQTTTPQLSHVGTGINQRSVGSYIGQYRIPIGIVAGGGIGFSIAHVCGAQVKGKIIGVVIGMTLGVASLIAIKHYTAPTQIK